MAIKFTHIGDVHLEKKLYNLPCLREDQKHYFQESVDIAIEKEVDYFIISGDLYDNNEPLPETVKFVNEEVERLKEADIRVLGQEGDHDKSINNHAWITVNNILPISVPGLFEGIRYSDYGYPDVIKNKDAQWLFIHGMVEMLWPFPEEKKHIPLESYLEQMPNLKGVLLSDIHKPLETTYKDIYIGYVGALGFTRLEDIPHRKGFHYFDGSNLTRIEIPLRRDIIHVNLNEIDDLSYDLVNVERPIFVVSYNAESKPHLSKINALYKEGFIITNYVSEKKKDTQDVKEIRTRLQTESNISNVLRQCLPKDRSYDLAHRLLSTDKPKEILDEFKKYAIG